MLAVIGCGNLNRTDDGVGVVVVRDLMARRPMAQQGAGSTSVGIFDAGTGGMEVLFQARGAKKLVIVDACLSGSEPGSVFEVPGHALENEPKTSFNLHDFRWDHALYAGRRIWAENFPSDVTVFLIEAATLDYGLELSPPVIRAAEIVATRIADLIESYLDQARV